MISQFNLVPSKRDRRDYTIVFPVEKSQYCDLRSKLPPVYDQGSLNSCTAQSTAAAIHYSSKTSHPSRLFLWYNTRSVDGNEKTNSGCTIRGAVHTTVKVGVCPEPMWPYKTDMFDDPPPPQCYEAATQWKMELYARVEQTHAQIEAALRADLPVIFGMRIYQSFHDARKDGLVKVPNTQTEKFLGGHAMVIVGCDPAKSLYTVRNSWGERWGDKGHCYIPYSLIVNTTLTYDLWVIKDLDAQYPHTVRSATSEVLVQSWRTPLDSFSRLDGFSQAPATHFEVTLPWAIKAYTLTPVGGFPAEWPSSWDILGSDDKKKWQVIDSKVDVRQSRDLTFPLITKLKHIRFVAKRSSKSNAAFGRRVSLKGFAVVKE